MTRWVLVCFVRAADALTSKATEMPPATKHQSAKEAEYSNSASSHIHFF